MRSMNYASFSDLVTELELTPHIEGGFFRETYRANEIVKTERGDRSAMTSIYYCLPSNDFSVWHKLVDLQETFFFHYGDPALIYIIEDRKIIVEKLSIPGKHELVIEPNTWFAIRPTGIEKPSNYSLMSCKVVPGFDYQDLIIADDSILNEIDESEHKLAISLLKSSHVKRKV